MNKIFFIVVVFFIVLLGLAGCKTLHPVLSTETKDSSITKTEIKIDTVWHYTGIDSITFAYLIQCGADNMAKDCVIDSLSKKLNAHIEIKNGLLTIKVKNRPEKYYSLYIYERTLAELYKTIKSIITVTKTEKEPLNRIYLIVSVIEFLLLIIIFLLIKK
jgi:hypothetical protein